MNDESTAMSVPDARSLSKVSTEDLWSGLNQAIGVTARAIARVAVIWAELERRGEDLSGVRFSLKTFLPMVARGRLMPEAVAMLAGQTRKLQLVSALPVDEQQALVDGREIAVFKADAEPARRTLADLTLSEAALAIRDGCVRSIEEQALAHRSKTSARSSIGAAKKRRGRPIRITVHKDTALIHIGAASVPIEDVLAALRTSGYLA